MDYFDFEELVSDLLGISDEERDDPDAVSEKFFEHFNIDFDAGFKFASALLMRTPTLRCAAAGGRYHAFFDGDGEISICRAPADSGRDPAGTRLQK